jgi:uncharacterized protein
LRGCGNLADDAKRAIVDRDAATRPATSGCMDMLSFLYQRHGQLLLGLVALTFPYFYLQAEAIRSNNDIETWLPRQTEVRQVYEDFKRDFGVEEVIVVGLRPESASPRLIEALASRIDRLPGIRSCWTPERAAAQMGQLGVSAELADQRVQGLLTSTNQKMVGIVALLSDDGALHRADVVQRIRDELSYSLVGNDVALTGPPVIVTELDRLGSQKSNRQFFAITVVICLGLLYFSFGHIGMSLATLGVTLWGIYVTQTVLAWFGGEMNFIMGSLSVLVMIFTLSIAVHFVSYYGEARSSGSLVPLDDAFKEAFAPCFLSTFTTLLGLVSLNVSSILPVAQFGYAAALGSIVSLIVGLGIVPALTTIWPDCQTRERAFRFDFGQWGDWVAQRRLPLLAMAAVLMIATAGGLVQLKSDVDPVDFLPRGSRVLADLKTIENDLTNIDSLEAVVDFGSSDAPFLDRLLKVRELSQEMAGHPGVRHVLSAASFFPEELPETPLQAARLLSTAEQLNQQTGWVVDEHRLWRISVRLRREPGLSPIDVLNDFDRQLAGESITFTGLTPLLKSAQLEIFAGFWQSFTMACLTISLVMIAALRSVVAGLIAMIPNIIPIWLVFGAVGYWGTPVDIGMMMTGSIALGISVDCTFHFLVRYREVYQAGGTSVAASRAALEHSGEPMLESTIICSVGMLALCLSSFVPTARFGGLMAAQMVASLLGELVLLPALLCCRPLRRGPRARSEGRSQPETSAAIRRPHFLNRVPRAAAMSSQER